jgi:hypothetical protein
MDISGEPLVLGTRDLFQTIEGLLQVAHIVRMSSIDEFGRMMTIYYHGYIPIKEAILTSN